MRFRFGSTLILCLFTCLIIPSAAQEKADTAATIRKLEERWTESYKNRKIDLLASVLAEDFVITVEDGNTYSKSGISRTAPTRQCRSMLPNSQTSKSGCTETPQS